MHIHPEISCAVRREYQRDLLRRATRKQARVRFIYAVSNKGEFNVGNSYVVTDINSVESFGGDTPKDGVWKPLRAKLGIEAFGVNAFIGRENGSRVIEDHTEEGSGHQELYVVLGGRARFELNEEQVEVPAGSLVFVSDPAVQRTAFAVEPNTTVLAVGAPAGSVYTPSSWDNPYTN